jgi:hypothetical protein
MSFEAIGKARVFTGDIAVPSLLMMGWNKAPSR